MYASATRSGSPVFQASSAAWTFARAVSSVKEPEYEGQGVGGTLVHGALDDVRRQHLPVLPLCSFVKAWIDRHPDYVDLVHERPASQVGD